MSIEVWFAFVIASTALLLIPGPTILLVLSYALSQGRKTGLATAAGAALGDLIAMTASLAGLGGILLTSASLFTALKWIGAAYLVYLGIKLFRSAATTQLDDIENQTETSFWKIFGHASAITALNPKSIVFFIAFVPQFINVETALLPQFTILILTFISLASITVLTYAFLADKLRQRIAKPSVFQWFSRLGGSALVAMGIATAIYKKSTS
ncbi:LysE family translocator [Curvivirga sp.]|uniref:LysE family translocator n=1 Tax=Curvivirga sp. TaxID=2856848 RepID=UPI003B58D808